MTTSGLILAFSGKMTQRETEKNTVVGGFLFSALEFHLFFFSCNKVKECAVRLSVSTVKMRYFVIQQLKIKYTYQTKDQIIA